MSDDAASDANRDTSSAAAPASGLLSIVATPIGNLEDITLRALRVLREADVVLAEDTRRTRGLCERHGIARQLRAFHAHSSQEQLEHVLSELAAGKHVALVTDAGTPLVSDPGSELVAEARTRGIRVESIPGPSAVITAITVAGIACDSFRFVGFLPRSGKRRKAALRELVVDRAATVMFESPQRLVATLNELAPLLGEQRLVAVCRELTKLHEEVARGSAAQLAERFANGARGEVTLVISGALEAEETGLGEAELDERIAELLEAGHSARDVVRALAEQTPLSKHDLYARVQAQKTAREEPEV